MIWSKRQTVKSDTMTEALTDARRRGSRATRRIKGSGSLVSPPDAILAYVYYLPMLSGAVGKSVNSVVIPSIPALFVVGSQHLYWYTRLSHPAPSSEPRRAYAPPFQIHHQVSEFSLFPTQKG